MLQSMLINDIQTLIFELAAPLDRTSRKASARLTLDLSIPTA